MSTDAFGGRWTKLPSDLPLLMTTKEAGYLAGVSAKHIRRLLADGAIRGTRVGGTWRVSRDGLLDFLGLV